MSGTEIVLCIITLWLIFESCYAIFLYNCIRDLEKKNENLEDVNKRMNLSVQYIQEWLLGGVEITDIIDIPVWYKNLDTPNGMSEKINISLAEIARYVFNHEPIKRKVEGTNLEHIVIPYEK